MSSRPEESESPRPPALARERRGAVEIWTIDRPQVKNALDAATLDGLAAACADLDPATRAVVLTGVGDSFASGGDLREAKAVVTAEDAAAFSERGARACRAIAEAPVPFLAAINGAAYGGGAELALACDLRVVDATTRIGFRQARMGVTTGWGTLDRLLTLVGAGTAARLLFTTADVTGEEALRIGLAEAPATLDATTALDTALALAKSMEAASPAAITAQKRLLRLTGPTRDAELAAFVATWTGPDHAEAMDAFFARRPSNFQKK